MDALNNWAQKFQVQRVNTKYLPGSTPSMGPNPERVRKIILHVKNFCDFKQIDPILFTRSGPV